MFVQLTSLEVKVVPHSLPGLSKKFTITNEICMSATLESLYMMLSSYRSFRNQIYQITRITWIRIFSKKCISSNYIFSEKLKNRSLLLNQDFFYHLISRVVFNYSMYMSRIVYKGRLFVPFEKYIEYLSKSCRFGKNCTLNFFEKEVIFLVVSSKSDTASLNTKTFIW